VHAEADLPSANPQTHLRLEPQLPLRHRVVVIVGGTTGLGFSAARACVEAGGRVVVVGRNPDSAKTAGELLGAGSSRVLIADATDSSTAPTAIDLALTDFGRFDALYHVAGGSGRRAGDGPLHEITDAGWDFTQKLNLTSLFYSNRAAVRQFLKQGAAITHTAAGPGLLAVREILRHSRLCLDQICRHWFHALLRRLLRAAQHPLQRDRSRPD